ncbi:cation-translocating P-type ATPase [Thalassorhabdus alkalitolerans]|uniref:Cation-translocating P-type ATPase n=1 Tax=Thalassorhabdus alkalitolerans TaxID=2282697 RepID=A0ABW0YN84_9BACI
MKWYKLSPSEVEKGLSTSIHGGLGDKEVKKRLEKVGYNKLSDKKKRPWWILFIQQFKDFMVLVLLAATIISGLLGEFVDAITIMIIVMINGVLGFIQEIKAEKSLDALKDLAAPQMTVKRNGEWKSIPSVQAVPGDIVKIQSGDRISADIRLIEANGLYIEESALTGESVPSEKQADMLKGEDIELADQSNMAFTGTMVTRGSGIGVIISTGMKTEMGKIAHLLQETITLATPLQRKLEQLGKVLIAAALLLTALVVILGVMQGQPPYIMFLSGVSLAVAAIPEGLPAIVTVVLALGVQRMIKRKAIVRKLPAVETLGCASVICSDKTGTLTQNQMTVTALWSWGNHWSVQENGIYKQNQKVKVSQSLPLTKLLSYGVLCNHAEIEIKGGRQGNKQKVTGDPTEAAMVKAAIQGDIHPANVREHFKILKEFPFDSERKRMSVIVESKEGRKLLVTKGAPDVLLDRANSCEYNGKVEALTSFRKQEIEKALGAMANSALRTIAIGYKELKGPVLPHDAEEAEKNLVLVGIQGMIDPPRPEAKKAIEECREAGIKTIMITGDHAATATAIAKDLRLLPSHGKVMEGKTLSKMDDGQLEKEVNRVYVYARVTPEHKLRIVKALQNQGHIVAMTGDGVNDAPALKASDIGVAMGKTGTDVAKEASSLILADDNFATIKAAIKEGRNIYDNIRKFIRYMLASNVGEILVMLFAMMLGLPLPLVAIQILWINLVTDGLPAMALGLDKAEGDVMKRSPRHPGEGIFARGLGWKIVSRGILIGLVTLAAFMTSLHFAPDDLTKAQTIAFATLVMAQLIHVFDCRSEHSVFHRNPFENVYLVFAVLSSIILMAVVIYAPVLQPVFHTTDLNVREWALVLGLAAIPTVALAGNHVFQRSHARRSKRKK